MSDEVVTRWTRARIALSAVVMATLFGVVIWRGHRLQAVDGKRLKELAERQYLKQIELPPRRGTIFDRQGAPLAISVDVDSVYANPREVGPRAHAVARALEQALGIDPWALQRRLAARRYFTWVKRRVTPREASRVRALKLKGVHLTRESKRFYPNRGLGSSVVGFAGLDGKGLEGVELRLDAWLRGSATRISGLRDAFGRSLFSEETQETAGHDVHLSLDKAIQFETEKAMADAFHLVRRRSGWISTVVLDPRTGDVLAMASVPSFNPNSYSKARPSQWRNRAVTDAFEPGSTLKIFTVAAALDAGAVRPDETFDCESGVWRVGRHRIHDSHPYGRLDLAMIMKKSSNICTAKVGFKLGRQGLYSRLRAFGFGSRTGIRLRGERAGILRTPGGWSDVGLANIAFGQGMTTTVLQLAQALTAVANGGVMMRPRLVQRLTDSRGRPVEDFPPRGKRVISAGTARHMLRMLRGVTEEGGTGVDAALERYSVAGKTGTAQKVDPVTRTYSPDLWVSSFAGVVPVRQPRLVIVVVVNEPEGDRYYGGEVAGPIFKHIAGKALAYLGVRPDRRPVQAVAGHRDPAAVVRAAPVALPGVALLSSPAPQLPGGSGRAGSLLVPDFTGMSIAEVLAASRKLGLRVRLMGSGVAVAQSPGPGPTPSHTLCRVSFRPPG